MFSQFGRLDKVLLSRFGFLMHSILNNFLVWTCLTIKWLW